MMQTYCKYTGVLIRESAVTTGLGIKGKDSIFASEHMLFNCSWQVILNACSFKPLLLMSTEQRRLLCVVIAVKSKLLEVHYPITADYMPDSECIKALPIMILAATRIALNADEWKEITTEKLIKRMAFRKDNANSFNWSYFAKSCLLAGSEALKYQDAVSKLRVKKISNDLSLSELENENALNELIRLGTKKGKKVAFTANHLNLVISLVQDEIRIIQKQQLSPATIESIQKSLLAPVERSNLTELERIRLALTVHLDSKSIGGINDAHVLHREAYVLTVQEIDNRISWHKTQSAIFDSIPQRTVQFTILEQAAIDNGAMTPAQLELAALKLRLQGTTNPALINILKFKIASLEVNEVTEVKGNTI